MPSAELTSQEKVAAEILDFISDLLRRSVLSTTSTDTDGNLLIPPTTAEFIRKFTQTNLDNQPPEIRSAFLDLAAKVIFTAYPKELLQRFLHDDLARHQPLPYLHDGDQFFDD